MCAIPVHHLGYFLLASLSTVNAGTVSRKISDVHEKFKTLFGKFELRNSYRKCCARMHKPAQNANEAARKINLYCKTIAKFSTNTQLSLAIYHDCQHRHINIARLLLHDRASRSLTWQNKG